jgi:hypothetical protein
MQAGDDGLHRLLASSQVSGLRSRIGGGDQPGQVAPTGLVSRSDGLLHGVQDRHGRQP